MGKYNGKLEENRRRDYLPEGKHDVVVASAELKYGDDASPKRATKSIKFMFTNDDGVAFWDCELEPLKTNDGNDNDAAITIQMASLENMGLEWGSVDGPQDFADQAEAFVMSGEPLGSTVRINITGRDSDQINPHTNRPYRNRNLYVNKLLDESSSGGSSTNATEVAVF